MTGWLQLQRDARRRAVVLAAVTTAALLQFTVPACSAAEAAAPPPCHHEAGDCARLHAATCADVVPLSHDATPVTASAPVAGPSVVLADLAGPAVAAAYRAVLLRQGADPPITLRFARLRN